MCRFLTPKQVSKILQINYRKVLDMIALGELEAYRIGGVYRVKESSFNQYLESVKVKTYWNIN
tara:strand:- start:635 stop:823 length:189 start_codon:yes stop_codon:yes gene_type:complete